MVYDEQLAQRIEGLLAAEPGVSSRKMFGGLGFMVDGHLTVAATRGGVMVRTDPVSGHEWVDGRRVTQVEMRGRAMQGWLLVDGDAVADDGDLRTWLDRALAFVRALPPKQA